METLILLRDECLTLAHALNRRATLGEDIPIEELQRRASELAASLEMFAGFSAAAQRVRVAEQLAELKVQIRKLSARVTTLELGDALGGR